MKNIQYITKKKFEELPKTAGVYLFYEKSNIKNQKSKIIYIGKAINIKERVKNHFHGKTWWERTLLRQDFGGRIGFIETDSEIEALILEAQLIKKHLPKFNVVWRDDKNYFYVAIGNYRGTTRKLTRLRQPVCVRIRTGRSYGGQAGFKFYYVMK